MATYFSQENLVDSETCSSSQLALDHDRMSFVKLYTGLTKIENLTDRLGYLSSFIFAIEETLEFCSTFSFNFRYCSKEIVGLTEMARKTLESAGVVPYLWASCPERLLPHKRAYVQLLQLLHSNEHYIAPQLRRRLRALLMPLTSQFSITKNSDWRQQDDWAETPLYRTIHITPGLHGAGRDQRMPPPPAPPYLQTPIFHRRSNCGTALTRSIKRKLWTVEELSPQPTSSSSSSYHKRRTRDAVRSRADCENDERGDQENAVPEESVVPFRQPRSTLRFGICFNRKLSSSQQNGGRLSNTHSLMNYKE